MGQCPVPGLGTYKEHFLFAKQIIVFYVTILIDRTVSLRYMSGPRYTAHKSLPLEQIYP